MSAAALLSLVIPVLNSIPTILPLAQNLLADIAAGKGNRNVTEDDIKELVRLMSLTSEDIYKRLGVTPPP